MTYKQAAECCERSEQCIEAQAGQHGRFDTIFAAQKSLSDLYRARDGSGYAAASIADVSAPQACRGGGATGGEPRPPRIAGQERGAAAFERTARSRTSRKRCREAPQKINPYAYTFSYTATKPPH